jgi:hypothetical protein
MTKPGVTALTCRSAERTQPPARSARLVLGAVLIAIVAAGCLPESRRGQGSGPADSSGGSATATISPSPASSSPAEPTPIVPPTPTPRPTFLVHVVVKGDSLNTIAHRFGTTARSIAFWNRATYPSLDPESAKYRPDLLKLGWTLLLIPNDIVDEQDLPDPSATAAADVADPSDEASTTDEPGTAADADIGPEDASLAPEDSGAPGDSAIPE